MKNSEEILDSVFAALSDPTRRAILERLAMGDWSVTELAEPFSMSLPAISKHLGVLEKASLITREKDGRVRRCRLTADPMKEAAQWIGRYRAFWQEQLEALGEYLSELMNQQREEDNDG